MTETETSGRLRRLECLRGAAAVYVAVHHYVHVVLGEQYPHIMRFFKFGQFAVLLFFVTSGFVIYYATAPRHEAFRGYFVRRFRRIYPPFICALVITYVAQCAIDGELADPQWGELAGNLLMLQDVNVAAWVAPYMTNASLWSLSYEWGFYMLFFPVLWLARGNVARAPHIVLAGAVLGFVAYHLGAGYVGLVLMYLPIWWAGVEMAREYLETNDVTFERQWFSLASVAVVTALWGVVVARFVIAGNTVVVWEHPVIEFRHFATAFVILVAGLTWHRLRWRGFYTLLGPFERFAPISYGLYVVHKPLLHVAADVHPLSDPWLELIWIVPITLALSWVAERFIHRYAVRWLRA